MKTIELAEWEINLIVNTLAKLPYEEVSVTIQNIKEQLESSGVEAPKNCRECKTPCGQPTYYGGSMCKYHDEIYRKCPERMM